MPNVKEWLESLHFSTPVYFTLLHLVWMSVLVLAVAVILKIIYRPRKPKYSRFRLLGTDSIWLFLIILCTVGVVSLAGPQIRGGYTVSQSGSIDVVVVQDISFTMRGNDVNPSRQEVAKRASLYLTDGNVLKSGDRVGLFEFGGDSRWVIPLSEDFESFKSRIAEIKHPDIYETETQLSTDFANVLEQIAVGMDKQDGFAKNNPWGLKITRHNSEKIIILFSDGNDEGTDKPTKSEINLKNKNIKVFCVGIGTKGGAQIKIKAYNDRDPSKPPEEKIVKSALQMRELEAMASVTGGDSFAYDSDSSFSRLQNFLQDAVNSNRSSMPRLAYSPEVKDIWWDVLAIPAIALLLLAVKKL